MDLPIGTRITRDGRIFLPDGKEIKPTTENGLAQTVEANLTVMKIKEAVFRDESNGPLRISKAGRK